MQPAAETVREYAQREGITLQTAYRRIWDGKVKAVQFMGRWLVSPGSREPVQPGNQRQVTPETAGRLA